jgi:chromosome partitioning protein
VIPNAVAVINGKGGTGKTSVVANVAGLAAAAGYRILAVDLDPQGNLGRDLGYSDVGGAPEPGEAPLLAALAGHTPLQPLTSVRNNLDVVPGGEALEDWAPLASSWRSRGRKPEAALERALTGVADGYNLVLLDCPPGNRELQLLAMHAAHYAVVPTKPDEASLDGMVRVARLFESVRADNRELELLGVILFGIEARARRVRAETRSQVSRELGDEDLVFDAEVRHVLAPARDARARGQLAHEYEQSVLTAPRFYEPGGREERLAASAPGLAGDYQALTKELLTRMHERSLKEISA